LGTKFQEKNPQITQISQIQKSQTKNRKPKIEIRKAKSENRKTKNEEREDVAESLTLCWTG